MAGMRSRDGEQELADVGGKMACTRVVSPASDMNGNMAVNPEEDMSTSSGQTTDNSTAASNQSIDNSTPVTQGEDKSSSLNQAADDMAASNQSTDNSTPLTQGEDKSSSLNQAADEMAASNQPTDNSTPLTQGEDKSSSLNQAADDMAASNQPTNNIAVSGSLGLMDVASLSRTPANVATADDPLTDVTTSNDELTDVTTADDELTDLVRITDNRSNNELSEDEPRDFSTLPLLVWLNIFMYLNPRDRLVVSVTCHTLYDVCMNSSELWHSMVIDIDDDDPDEEIIKMKAADRSALRAHCHRLQKLVIKMRCFLSIFLDERSNRVLLDSAKKSPLKHLEVINKEEGYSACCDRKIKRIWYFLHTFATSPNASQLRCLKIKGFDWTIHGKSGVVETLKKSSFTSLTHLHLEQVLERLHEFCRTLGKFQNLQYLTIPFSCISNCVLDNFSRHLKEVHFVVYESDSPIQDVSHWPQVLTRSPELTLGLFFIGKPVTAKQIISFVQSSLMPVSLLRNEDTVSLCDYFQFDFLEFVIVSCAHLTVLRCKYREFFETMGYICSHQMPLYTMEDILIDIVNQCPKLYHLEFGAVITSEAVLTLAAMRKWKVLVFYAASIPCPCGTSNTVKKQYLDNLCEDVSKILGRTWRLQPLNKAHFH